MTMSRPLQATRPDWRFGTHRPTDTGRVIATRPGPSSIAQIAKKIQKDTDSIRRTLYMIPMRPAILNIQQIKGMLPPIPYAIGG